MRNSNLIDTFFPQALDGKDYAGILLFFANLKQKAESEGYNNIELVVNEDGSIDVLEFFQTLDSPVHPDKIAEIDRLLEPYL